MVETKTERDWTIEQETVLFKAICRYKPAGQHKHFRMLCIYQMVNNSNIQSRSPLTIQDIWNKLSTLYNLEGLDELEDSSSFMAEEENGKEPLYFGSLGGSLAKDGTYLRDFGLPWGDFGSIMEEKAAIGDSRESSPGYESDKSGGIPESQANSDESDGDDADKGSELESARNTPVESVRQGSNKRARTPVRKAAAPATARTTRSSRQRTAAKKRKEASSTPEAAEENKGDNASEAKEEDTDQQSEKEESPQPEMTTTTSRSKRARTQSKPAAKAKATPSRRSNRRK